MRRHGGKSTVRRVPRDPNFARWTGAWNAGGAWQFWGGRVQTEAFPSQLEANFEQRNKAETFRSSNRKSGAVMHMVGFGPLPKRDGMLR